MKIRLNDSELVLTTSPESQICVAELLAAREVAPQGVAVALNGAVLPRSRWPRHVTPTHRRCAPDARAHRSPRPRAGG